MLWGSWALSAVPSQIQRSYSKCQFPQSQPRHLKEKKSSGKREEVERALGLSARVQPVIPHPSTPPSFVCYPWAPRDFATTLLTLQGAMVSKTSRKGESPTCGGSSGSTNKQDGLLCSKC